MLVLCIVSLILCLVSIPVIYIASHRVSLQRLSCPRTEGGGNGGVFVCGRACRGHRANEPVPRISRYGFLIEGPNGEERKNWGTREDRPATPLVTSLSAAVSAPVSTSPFLSLPRLVTWNANCQAMFLSLFALGSPPSRDDLPSSSFLFLSLQFPPSHQAPCWAEQTPPSPTRTVLCHLCPASPWQTTCLCK